jgi:hypothetical protein
MRCKTKPEYFEAIQYRKGMEDGTIKEYCIKDDDSSLEPYYWTTVEPYDERQILDVREVPVIWGSECPHRVKEGDWILTREHDGERCVESKKDFKIHYEPA